MTWKFRIPTLRISSSTFGCRCDILPVLFNDAVCSFQPNTCTALPEAHRDDVRSVHIIPEWGHLPWWAVSGVQVSDIVPEGDLLAGQDYPYLRKPRFRHEAGRGITLKNRN
jgi:hypothetical protein